MTIQQLLWKLFKLWLQGYGGAKVIYAWEGAVNHADLATALLDTAIIECSGIPISQTVLDNLKLTHKETILLLHWD